MEGPLKTCEGRLQIGAGEARIHLTQPWAYADAGSTVAWAAGEVFDRQASGEPKLDGQALAAWAAERPLAPPGLCDRFTGHAGLIRARVGAEGWLELASDRVRSCPLFYAVRGRTLWVSDSLVWLRETLRPPADPLALYSVWRTAQLASGADTPLHTVRQILAGQTVRWDGAEVALDDAPLYRHREDPAVDEATVRARLDAAVHTMTERLVRFADGAPIVVPLSGGYDSRLVLAGLVAAGYRDLVTFTYGQPGSGEVRVSQRTAAALGVPWHGVAYTPAKWRAWRRSADAQRLRADARRVGVVPHTQEPIALVELRRAGVLAPGSVVASGHSGDLHAGSVVTPAIYATPPTPAGYLDRMLATYFGINAVAAPPGLAAEADGLAAALRSKLASEISPTFRQAVAGGAGRPEHLVDELERWVWRERCSKYLVHSMANYTAHGLRWWLPLWDPAFTDLWMDVPLALRGRDTVYHAHVDALFAQVAGAAPPQGIVRPDQRPRRARLIRALLKVPPIQVARMRRRHPFGWYHQIPLWAHLRAGEPGVHITGLLADRELRWWQR